MSRRWLSHIAAFLTVAVWGTTFVSTKVLLGSGLTPVNIFVMRFIIAYLCLCFLCAAKKKFHLFCNTLRDELGMMFCGLTGGSLYFITENTALKYTMASNASFIVCSAPLFTVLLTLFLKRVLPRPGFVRDLEDIKITPSLVGGTILALTGMAIVIFDGATQLTFSAHGDLMALSAALLWAVYSLEIGSMTKKYGSAVTTRKVFFYGLMTAIPFLDFGNLPSISNFDGRVIANLLFLAVVASFVCFLVWNTVMHSLGNVTASNYIYFNPVFTLLNAHIFLGERLGVTAGIGCTAILAGVILAVKIRARE